MTTKKIKILNIFHHIFDLTIVISKTMSRLLRFTAHQQNQMLRKYLNFQRMMHTESKLPKLSTLGIPIGGIAGLFGSMLGVGGGVIMVCLMRI